MIALGDAAFDFQFEDSDLLATMVGDDTYEKCPEKYTQHCWLVVNIYLRYCRYSFDSFRWSAEAVWEKLFSMFVFSWEPQ